MKHVYGGPTPREALFGEKSKAKSEAIEKKKESDKAVDKKWDKYNASKGLTPKGKRKWHYYNTIIK
jgi:hypothetical protein